MLNLILFGPPGSGKGTQAKYLVEKYNLVHISTGDLFRAEIGNQTELGLKAKAFMDEGNLVPDEVTIGMFKNKLEAHPEASGFIFDGFPRTEAQAAALDTLLEEKETAVTTLVELKVPDAEIVTRILNRGKTSGRVDDQSEEKIQNRINVYKAQTAVVADFYEKQDKAADVDGMGSIEEVFARLCTEVDNAAVVR